jgi:2-isopropylmalate synthase
VILEWDGECHSSTSNGNGPVDASINAVKKILKKKVRIEEFLIQAITRGSDDLGKVHMQVEHKNVVYYGFSASTDIISASVEAFIDAMSQIV